MAASRSSKATSTGDSAAPFISPHRKKEVLGLVLMVLALLLSLAFLTYTPGDDSIVRSAHLSEALLNPGEMQAQFPVENALGLVGAELARLLVPGFLGYSILLFSGLLLFWGYAIFRHWSLRGLLYPSGLILLSAFVLACFVGWFGHAFNTDLARWAGAVGMGMAGWMQGVFGPPGSFILLLLAVAVMLLLVIDHDIQRSVDRVLEAFHTIGAGLRSWWSGLHFRRSATSSASKSEAQSSSKPSDPRASSPSSDASAPDADTATPPENSSPEPTETSEQAPSSEEPAPRPSGSDGSSPDDTAETIPPVTIQVSGTDEHGRPLRRNDLFRARVQAATQGTADGSDEPSDPPTQELEIEELEAEFSEAFDEKAGAPPTSASSDEAEENGPPDPSSSDTASTEELTDEADPPSASEPASSSPEPDAPDGASKGDDVAMTVQEQIEEEKADEIDRPAETPEDFEYEAPPLDLLDEPTDDDPTIDREELEENKRILLDKLDTYNIEIEEIKAVVGPTVTRYEMTPAPGIKVSRIKSLEDDLAMAMAAPGIRMMAPIPGKRAVGVEIPNRNRELVRLREVIGTAKFRDTDMELPIPMGKTIEGEVYLANLAKMPHLLIAGATGSGKSVGLNSIITGLIYACHPANLRFVIIDPKKIELQQYTSLETQFVAKPEDVDQTVITDIEEASGVLKSVEKEMEERYDLLSDANVRGISGYNKKFQEGKLDPTEGHRHMPYVVVVVDELADLMMTVGDDIEGPISRLAQMARAVGIHLVLATQRPSVDVITGVIKANFPSRIAYEVASMADSRTILDQGGAEGLVGNGDMLFLSGSDLRRLQGPFVRVEEVERVVDHVSEQPGVTPYTLPSLQEAGHGPDATLGVEDTDENFEEAARVIVRRQQGSVSLLQRKLAVGYTRAARIVDQLEEAGIVGPFNGTKAREVLVDSEEELDRLLQGEDAPDSENGEA